MACSTLTLLGVGTVCVVVGACFGLILASLAAAGRDN